MTNSMVETLGWYRSCLFSSRANRCVCDLFSGWVLVGCRVHCMGFASRHGCSCLDVVVREVPLCLVYFVCCLIDARIEWTNA